MKRDIEIAVVDSPDIAPISITISENGDMPRLVINANDKIWLSLNRRIIAGIFEVLPQEIDKMLNQFLQEQRNYELANDGEDADYYGV